MADVQDIFTIDAHAAGEPCRVVHAGLPDLQGSTMAERRRLLRAEWDWVRTGLTHEPRGHSGMFGAVVTRPVHRDSAYGLIFFDPVGYMDACGHGTLCSIAVWRRTFGIPDVPFGIDNPDGSVTRVLALEGDDRDCVIELALPRAAVLVDPCALSGVNAPAAALVHCGNTFLMTDARTVGIADIRLLPTRRLYGIALELRAAANSARERAVNGGLEVMLYQEVSGEPRSFVTFVLFNGSQIDRSPCGTGSAALTALLLSRGVLGAWQPIRTIGPAGAYFELSGRLRAGSPPEADVHLRGTAHITGVHQWIFSGTDSLAHGYLLA